MNLNDTILLRGWINHLEWEELTGLAGDGSPKLRVRRLRKGLALKARYYGKPEWEALWLSERFPVGSWRDKALASLNKLNALADPTPALGHRVGQWFSQDVCRMFSPGIDTLSDLMDYLDACHAGQRAISEPLAPLQKRLWRFFEEQAVNLGRDLNRRLPAVRDEGGILDRLTVLPPLNIEEPNKADGNILQAANDIEAAALWLKAKGGRSANTFDVYRREANRLLLWLGENRLMLAELKVNHAEQYYAHLEKPPAHWLRPRKPKLTDRLLPTQVLVAGLTPKSINQTRTVLCLMCNYLQQAGYLRGNPFLLSSKPHIVQQTQVNRWLDLNTWQWLWQWINALPTTSELERQQAIRTRWLFALLYHTGMRREEVAHGRMSDFIKIDDYWQLRVVGKGGKERYVTVNTALFDELMAYRNALGHRGYPAPRETLPLISSVYRRKSREPMTPRAIGQIIQDIGRAAEHACPDEQIRDRISKMTTHWLRHTNATHRLMAGGSLETTQDELGHADPRTTRIYAKTTSRQRIDDAEKLAALFVQR